MLKEYEEKYENFNKNIDKFKFVRPGEVLEYEIYLNFNENIERLVAYTLLVEDNYNTIVRKGYVYYQADDKLLKQTITDNMKHQVIKALKAIRHMIKTEQKPIVRPTPQKRKACGYKRYCPWADL